MIPSPEEFEINPDMASLEENRKEILEESYNVVARLRGKNVLHSERDWTETLARDGEYLRWVAIGPPEVEYTEDDESNSGYEKKNTGKYCDSAISLNSTTQLKLNVHTRHLHDNISRPDASSPKKSVRFAS